MTQQTYLDDLQKEVRMGTVVAVVGAGISIATTGTDARGIASWTGLLRHGVQRCVEVDPNLTSDWTKRMFDYIESPADFDLLAAAEKISSCLKKGGEYGRWLQDSVGTLKAKHPEIATALSNLEVPIATTNYDGVIEEVTGQPHITWLQQEQVQRWIRRDAKGILHMHGYWQDPGSVVLGIRSYDSILGDEYLQTILKSIWTTRTILFVGFGRGLADPNFGALLEWARKIFSQSVYRHYRLVRSSQVKEITSEHAGDRVAVIGFGEEHADLIDILGRLAPNGKQQAKPELQIGVASNAPSPNPTFSFGSATLGRSLYETDRKELNTSEVERQIFGMDVSQVTKKLRLQFRSIAIDTTASKLYITGNKETTASLVLHEHFSSYYQGNGSVLKMQTFELPSGACQFRPSSIGNDPVKDYVPENWVFLQNRDRIEQLLLTDLADGEPGYVLSRDSAGGRLFIVTVYPEGRVFYTGSEQIWLELADLCGRSNRTAVFFGGKIDAVNFRSVFELTFGDPLRFFRFPQEAITSGIAGKEPTLTTFGGLIERYDSTASVRNSTSDQQSWQAVLDLWKELSNGEGDQWWSVDLKNVTADVVLIVTGKLRDRQEK